MIVDRDLPPGIQFKSNCHMDSKSFSSHFTRTTGERASHYATVAPIAHSQAHGFRFQVTCSLSHMFNTRFPPPSPFRLTSSAISWLCDRITLKAGITFKMHMISQEIPTYHGY